MDRRYRHIRARARLIPTTTAATRATATAATRATATTATGMPSGAAQPSRQSSLIRYLVVRPERVQTVRWLTPDAGIDYSVMTTLDWRLE